MKAMMKVRIIDTGFVGEEENEVTNEALAEKQLRQIVDYFNSTLRPHESRREFVGFEMIAEAPKGDQQKEFEEIQLITIDLINKLNDYVDIYDEDYDIEAALVHLREIAFGRNI